MAEREKKFSFLTAAGDGLLLICALAGLAGSFLSLYGDGMPMVVSAIQPTALDVLAYQADEFVLAAVVFALLSLAVWSLPRFRGAAAGTMIAAWACAVVMNWEDAVRGAGVTVRIVTTLFSRRVSWGRVFTYSPGLNLTEETQAVQLFLLLALAGLAIVLGWAVVRARRWWLTALLVFPPLLPGLLADLYPGWLPFMTLCVCCCAMLLTDLCKWAAPDRRGQLTLTALPAVGLLLAGLTVLLPQEGYTRPEWALKAEEQMYAAGDKLSEFFAQWDGPFHSANGSVGSSSSADLRDAGPLQYTGRTMLRITADYDQRLYLWGAALGNYENGRWTQVGGDVYQEYLDALEAVGIDDAPSPLLFPDACVQTVQIAKSSYFDSQATYVTFMSKTATVERVRVSGVYVPYQLVEQDWAQAGVEPVRDSYLTQPGGGPSYTVSFAPAAVPYSVQSSDPAEEYYRDYVYRHYLDVPEELRGELEELANEGWLTFALGDPYMSAPVFDDPVQAAQQVGSFLGSLCEYDPDTPAAPAGTDPVEYFLLESRRGYCMHFASAAALMLRTMGFPARYVSGYTAQPQPGQQVDVPDHAAHAWVEVYVDGYGWHPVEVTPATAFTWYQQGQDEPSPTPSEDVPESETPEPTPTPTPELPPSKAPEASETPSAGLPGGGDDGPQGGGIDWTPFIQIGKWLAGAAGVFALLWLGQWLPKRHRRKKLTGANRNRAALDGYGYLMRMERWGGQIDPRALELAQKAKFSQHTLTAEELDEMRALVDRERAGLCASPQQWKRLAARYLWGRPKAGKNAGKSPENEA